MKGLLHSGQSRVSSPPAGHLTAYANFIMDKYIKAKKTLKRYLSVDFLVFIPYFPKRLNLDKEEDIVFLRVRDFLS